MRSGGRRRAGTDRNLRIPVRGSLYFGPTPLDDFGPRMQARLLDSTGQDVILPLHYARIARIEGVMHISGFEYYLRGRKGSPQRWKQSWLCAPEVDAAKPFLDRVRSVNATGFSDDDVFGDD